MDFLAQMQCDEQTPTYVPVDVNFVVYLTDNKVMEVVYYNGALKGIKGYTAKVEQIELNYVRITCGNNVEYVELGDNVRWLDGEEDVSLAERNIC